MSNSVLSKTVLTRQQATLINTYLKQNKDPKNWEEDYNDFLRKLSPSFRSIVNRRNFGVFLLKNSLLANILRNTDDTHKIEGLLTLSGYLIPKLYAPLSQVMAQDEQLNSSKLYLHFIVHGSFSVSIDFKTSFLKEPE